MTIDSPLDSTLAPVSIDRVRVITRSIRCFILGSIGTFPVLGLPFGFLAMRLQRQVASEIGENWNFRSLHLFWAVAMLAIAIVNTCGLAWVAFSMTTLTFLAHFYMAHRVATRAKSGEWNPAGHLVYWGVALAYAGRALAGALVILVITTILEQILNV